MALIWYVRFYYVQAIWQALTVLCFVVLECLRISVHKVINGSVIILQLVVCPTNTYQNRRRAPLNVEQAKVAFAGLNFQVETGSHFLGSFRANKVDDWVYSIKKLQVPRMPRLTRSRRLARGAILKPDKVMTAAMSIRGNDTWSSSRFDVSISG